MGQKVKAWQIALFVAAFAALGVTTWRALFRDSPQRRLSNSIMFVDVESGQLFEFEVGGRKAVMPPERHPQSNKIALVPVYKEDGKWLVPPRYRDTLTQVEVENRSVDPSSLEVQVASEKFQRVKR
ncbi:MAG TPA: hypothetical protein PLU35_07635 [Phycisphaerales bacterium]|nr:hypothetical protein [Phycisphaerales bacterium]